MLDMKRLAQHGVDAVSNTFHGRDVFAPAAALLASGDVGLADLGTPASEWIPGWLEEPTRGAGRGQEHNVSTANQHWIGNLISNIDEQLIRDFPDPAVAIAGRHVPMRQTYGRATPGDHLALVNSFGVVEIACAEGNAAESLGLGRGAPIVVTDGATA